MTQNGNNHGDPGDEENGTVAPSGDTTVGDFEQVESPVHVDTDQWVQVNQLHYDREENRELATALVYAIAEAKDVDPTNRAEMPPLYDSIDAQSIEETFFGPPGVNNHQREQSGAVTFMYDGYKVALRADGWIFVYEPR